MVENQALGELLKISGLEERGNFLIPFSSKRETSFKYIATFSSQG